MQPEIINYKITDVSVSDIVFPKDELRTKIYFENLDELARSIRTVGLLNPLTVRTFGDKYELIAGFRRLKACEIANYAVVPCRVVESDDTRADLQKLHENMFREEVNPVDEGNFFKRLLIKNNWRIVDLSCQIHKSNSYVSRRIQLTEADPLIVGALADGQINLSIADELNKIDDPATRSRLLHYVIKSGATVDTVRMWRVQYEIDRDSFPPTPTTPVKDGGNGPAMPKPEIAGLNNVPHADRKIEETVIETRPCYSCLAKTDTRDIFTLFLCADCKKVFETALHPKEPIELEIKPDSNNQQ